MITLAFYNLKGGVGKTTTAVNMACLAAQAKRNTVLWDWDPQAAASWYLGVDEPADKAIKLLSKGLPSGALEVPTAWPRLSVVPADLSLRSIDSVLAEAESPRKLLKKLVEPFSEQTSILIFDCPPTLSPAIEYLLGGVDLVLVPMIPSPLSIRASEQVAQFFAGKKHSPREIVGFYNMVDGRRSLHKEWLANSAELAIPMLKTGIPMDAAAEGAAVKRQPLVALANTGRAAQAYRQLWKEIAKLLNSRRAAPAR